MLNKERKNRFSLRKLTIGLASVAISSLFLVFNQQSNIVKADDVQVSTNNNAKIVDHSDTRKPIAIPEYVSFQGREFTFETSLAKSVIFKDENGTKLKEVSATSENGLVTFHFDDPQPINTCIIAVPISYAGVEGKPAMLRYTDKSKLKDAMTKYGSNLDFGGGLKDTPLFKNATKQAQDRYVKAMQTASDYQINRTVKQETLDSAACELEEAYLGLSNGKDTRKPIAIPEYVSFQGREFTFETSLAKSLIFEDESGKKLKEVSATSENGLVTFHFDDPQPINTCIIAVPISYAGVKGKPAMLRYTDKSKLIDAMTKYGSNLDFGGGLKDTPLFKNATKQAQDRYVKAMQTASDYQINRTVKQEALDSAACELEKAYLGLSNGKDTRKPIAIPEYVSFQGREFTFETSLAKSVIFEDENGKKLKEVSATSENGLVTFHFDDPQPINTCIIAVPISYAGVEGKPAMLRYTDKSKLKDAMTKYGSNLDFGGGLKDTPLFKNATKQAQDRYVKAMQTASDYQINRTVKQEALDSVAQELKDAYYWLANKKSPSVIVENKQDNKDKQKLHTNEDENNSILSISNNNSIIKIQPNKSNESPFITTAYAPIINNNKNYKLALWDENGKFTGKYISTNSNWKVFAKKMINGKLYYRLGSQKQWVPAQFLMDKDKKALEIPMKAIGHVDVLFNKPNYKVALYNQDGHVTGYLRTNSNWKIFSKKMINGKLMYRLGTQKQWIPAQYIKVK